MTGIDMVYLALLGIFSVFVGAFAVLWIAWEILAGLARIAIRLLRKVAHGKTDSSV